MQPRGSSPLTRGKQRLLGNRTDRPRLIPAHAGKTAFCMASMRREPAHPRSRGENGYTPGRDIYHFGSSPLTRGKRATDPARPSTARLIPAHAGKTRQPCGTTRGRRAHPRSRGENMRVEGAHSSVSGSSPLTRGKPLSSSNSRNFARLIPAHAGKTHHGNQGSAAHQAHPRSRGENHPCRCYYARVSGSSPLTRGKLSPFRC